MIRQFTDLKLWQQDRAQQKLSGKTLGFVPTMGALHQGHLSLMEQSQRQNDFTLVSLFVNPTQFSDPKDLQKYPQKVNEDLQLLTQAGVDFVWLPTAADLYRDEYRYRITESDLSGHLCGAHRPGHFTGVLTVVMKLLNIAHPERAYFGEKDYQQLQLIRGMVDAFFMPVEIHAGETIREEDGLAMSSRNLRLSSEQRKLAPAFYQALRSPKNLEEVRRALQAKGFQIDYLEDFAGRRYGAVALGEVRLIDNVPL